MSELINAIVWARVDKELREMYLATQLKETVGRFSKATTVPAMVSSECSRVFHM